MSLLYYLYVCFVLTHNCDSEPVEIVVSTAGESSYASYSAQYSHSDVVEELLEGKVDFNRQQKALRISHYDVL